MKKLITTTILLCTILFSYAIAQENNALGFWEGKEFTFDFDIECKCSPAQKDSLKNEFKPYLEEGMDYSVTFSELTFDKDMLVTGNLMNEDIDGDYQIKGDTIIVTNYSKDIKFERLTNKKIPQIKFYTTEVKGNSHTLNIEGIGDVKIQPNSFTLVLEKDVDFD